MPRLWPPEAAWFSASSSFYMMRAQAYLQKAPFSTDNVPHVALPAHAKVWQSLLRPGTLELAAMLRVLGAMRRCVDELGPAAGLPTIDARRAHEASAEAAAARAAQAGCSIPSRVAQIATAAARAAALDAGRRRLGSAFDEVGARSDELETQLPVGSAHDDFDDQVVHTEIARAYVRELQRCADASLQASFATASELAELGDVLNRPQLRALRQARMVDVAGEALTSLATTAGTRTHAFLTAAAGLARPRAQNNLYMTVAAAVLRVTASAIVGSDGDAQ